MKKLKLITQKIQNLKKRFSDFGKKPEIDRSFVAPYGWDIRISSLGHIYFWPSRHPAK